ncbi:hypothetical protein [Heyndrickxia oleronia]|jgi:hypothetical protein|uniref:hypothetical protein n=1 Tax=Heyndrickxia oleronia TaxID=38875 RepID=UPI0024300708|nr:hypothetical protein [Heyndrickxia oleronia]MCI1593230.1 hypothetical protein [Heyndrickxia oleronia]MCI1615471.1 hypothetical protein [Heyndrickxia oleronia]MCI1746179.1 hypothetical protein [Heyndrickxia oleronia]MCI1763562.1 hypothetical protein [Heyndrickxia oleronia]
MELEKLDLELLKAIYEKDNHNKSIDWESLNFESNNHKAFHLEKLERNGYISIEKNTLIPGGQRDPKYGTAVAMVWSEGIHILEKGKKAIR